MTKSIFFQFILVISLFIQIRTTSTIKYLMRFQVTGKVKNVDFKKHTQRKAKQWCIVGFCKNKDEDYIIGEAIGDKKSLK